jgi:hypothetical protein
VDEHLVDQSADGISFDYSESQPDPMRHIDRSAEQNHVAPGNPGNPWQFLGKDFDVQKYDVKR